MRSQFLMTGGSLTVRKSSGAAFLPVVDENAAPCGDDAQLDAEFSPLQMRRLEMAPTLPSVFETGPVTAVEEDVAPCSKMPAECQESLGRLFPSLWGKLAPVTLASHADPNAWAAQPPMRIGIVLSGGQAPGGHNVIAGVYDYIKCCNANSQLFGFLMGPSGIYEHRYVEITDAMMNRYRNQGGFDMIRSGRHKVDTEEQKAMSLQIVKKLDLHGLVVVGGDDSNTNAAILAEYFAANGSSTRVVGVPKTIDGDLKNEYVEISFGFDTAVKTYAEFIGNLSSDVATSGKYYHFIRLMGRSASNVTLHCALLTRPNLALIGEEIQRDKRTLSDLVEEIVDLVVKRQDCNKNYGIILVPEGLIEFIPEVGSLIRELNTILATEEFSVNKLTPGAAAVFEAFPESIQNQLLLDRDPHGNIQISRIATERLLILMVKKRLLELNRADNFFPRSHFFGYEGRAGLPSLFDSNYCYALGYCAAALVDNGKSGYMAVVRNLAAPPKDWLPGGCPLTSMMTIEQRHGRDVPVIRKYYVELDTSPFTDFAAVRGAWKLEDLYCSPGPIQFEGPCAELVNFMVKPPTRGDLLPETAFGFEATKTRFFFPKSLAQLSPLQRDRLKAPIPIPEALSRRPAYTVLVPSRKFNFADPQTEASVARSFPLQCRENKNIAYITDIVGTAEPVELRDIKCLRIGVLLNGQQSPGCGNVLVGLWERLCAEFPRGKLFGFVGGVAGLTASPPHYIEITREDLALTRNQGGFDLLGREKESEMVVATAEGLEATCRTCEELKLDGLVLIGGRYTLTDVAILAEEFLRRQLRTAVVGVPASQNNNIDTSIIESSLGFDSASKCYSSLIGNLSFDGASSAKYWIFVRLMGADKSQIAVEVALSTHPNIVLVSEAYGAGDKTLDDVVTDITDTVVFRASQGLFFGTVVIPEGLVASLPQFRQLISELRLLFANRPFNELHSITQQLLMISSDDSLLSPWSYALFKSLPEYFRHQLVQPRTLGSLELTRLATEELLADMVSSELLRRQKTGSCPKFNFTPLCFYFGYQGRSSLPSNFDCSLGLAHGTFAALVVKSKLTGYVTTLRGLAAPPQHWIPIACPATAFLRLQSPSDFGIYPQNVPVVPSDMVRLQGKLLNVLLTLQQKWENAVRYASPGPIQFNGPLSGVVSRTLSVEHKQYLNMLAQVHEHIDEIRRYCGSGASETALQMSVGVLSILRRLHAHAGV